MKKLLPVLLLAFTLLGCAALTVRHHYLIYLYEDARNADITQQDGGSGAALHGHNRDRIIVPERENSAYLVQLRQEQREDERMEFWVQVGFSAFVLISSVAMILSRRPARDLVLGKCL